MNTDRTNVTTCLLLGGKAHGLRRTYADTPDRCDVGIANTGELIQYTKIGICGSGEVLYVAFIG